MTYIVRSMFWTYIFAFLAIPIGYGIRVLYSQQLTVADYGVIYSIIGLFALISTFNDMGFSESLNYFATKYHEKKKYSEFTSTFVFAVLMQAITAFIISLILWFIAPILSTYYFKTDITQMFRLFIPYFFLMNVAKPFIILPNAKQKQHITAISEPLRLAVVLLTSLLLLVYSYQVVIPIAWTLSFGVVLIVYAWIAYGLYKKHFAAKVNLNKKLFTSMLKFGWPIILGVGASLVLGKIDIQLILLLTDSVQAAYYINALALANILPLLTGPMSFFLFPLTTKLMENKDLKRLRSVLLQMIEWILVFSIPMVLTLFFFGGRILGYVFGPEYVQGTTAMIILSIGLLLYGIGSFSLSILGGLGKPLSRTKILYATAIINVVLDLMLIPLMGITGAALGTTVSFLVMTILTARILKREIAVSVLRPNLLTILLCNAVILLGFFVVDYFIVAHLIVEVVIAIAVAGALYLIVLFATKIFSVKKFKDIAYMVKDGN